jgi:hypothetical protein
LPNNNESATGIFSQKISDLNNASYDFRKADSADFKIGDPRNKSWNTHPTPLNPGK